MNPYRFMIPLLKGTEINRRLDYYRSLVGKGIAGFIVFGGAMEQLRAGILKLQDEAEFPLIICSDLEQGLGQQVRGGTLFPPAMAMKEIAIRDMALFRKAFRQMAEEAAYVGINTILAPVLDINTNPTNPIIATRAFGEDPETVAAIGSEVVKIFRENGIRSCGKHFPGHGDTSVDSHISLPVLSKSLEQLEGCEMVPFEKGVQSGLDMVMLGHLSVPAIDPSGKPMTVSPESVAYLRKKLGFEGIIITDAMIMGGLGSYSEEEGSLLALKAGVDVILYPTDPDAIADFLLKHSNGIEPDRLITFRKDISTRSDTKPSFGNDLAEETTRRSIVTKGDLPLIKNPTVVVLTDDEKESGEVFFREIYELFPSAKKLILTEDTRDLMETKDSIIAIFSKTRAWKGGTASWILETLKRLRHEGEVFITFGNPYVLNNIGDEKAKIYAWWDSPSAQRAAARIITERHGV